MPIQSISMIAALTTLTSPFPANPPAVGTYVGKLREKWQFPSDHIPVGITIDRLHVASWNVLAAKFLWRVTKKDSQGLQKSMLVKEHAYIGKTKLTIREQHTVGMILAMISHLTHPRSIIALQECGEPFLKELLSRLPPNFTVIADRGNGIVIDKTNLEILDEKTAHVFPKEPKRSLQNILVREKKSNQFYRLINVHIPGDPARPSRFEFTQYLTSIFDPEIETIAMGDMNFNEIEMKEALGHSTPFSIHSSYCTNISPYTYFSKAIDHFITHTNSKVTINTPDQVLEGLQSTVDLLSTKEYLNI